MVELAPYQYDIDFKTWCLCCKFEGMASEKPSWHQVETNLPQEKIVQPKHGTPPWRNWIVCTPCCIREGWVW